MQSKQRWIDLHLHSTASDGAYSPAYLMEMARARGLSAVALTDHDSVAGVAEAGAKAAALGLEFIPGIELEAGYSRGALHILGYLIDPVSPSLLAQLERINHFRCERNRQIIRRLQQLGVPVDYDAIVERVGRENFGRPHIADAMVRIGAVHDATQAFEKYLGNAGAARVPRDNLSTSEAVAAIRDAGGIASLAHPGLIPCNSFLELRTLLRGLVDAGLQAIEVQHPSHSDAQSRELSDLARRMDLVATGGSDFHRLGTRCESGVGFGGVRVAYDVLEALRKKTTGVVTQ